MKMKMMNKEEARKFLLSIANALGTIKIEQYTCEDGEKMIEAINLLQEGDE